MLDYFRQYMKITTGISDKSRDFLTQIMLQLQEICSLKCRNPIPPQVSGIYSPHTRPKIAIARLQPHSAHI